MFYGNSYEEMRLCKSTISGLAPSF